MSAGLRGGSLRPNRQLPRILRLDLRTPLGGSHQPCVCTVYHIEGGDVIIDICIYIIVYLYSPHLFLVSLVGSFTQGWTLGSMKNNFEDLNQNLLGFASQNFASLTANFNSVGNKASLLEYICRASNLSWVMLEKKVNPRKEGVRTCCQKNVSWRRES